MILLAQLKFRKGLSASEAAGLKYRMWLYPVSSYLALAFLVLLTVLFYVFKLQPTNVSQGAVRSAS